MKTLCALLVLCLSAAAQTSPTLIVTADDLCNWTLDGKPMGILQDSDSKSFPVTPGDHLIEATSTRTDINFRTKVRVEQDQTAVAIQVRKPAAPPPPSPPQTASGDTWTDPATKLVWAKKDNGANIAWPEAVQYCSKLKLAGYTDWLLPTYEELIAMYDPNLENAGAANQKYQFNKHIKGNLQITGIAWSGTESDDRGVERVVSFHLPPNQFRLAEQKEGFPNRFGFDYAMRALCVRDNLSSPTEPKKSAKPS